MKLKTLFMILCSLCIALSSLSYWGSHPNFFQLDDGATVRLFHQCSKDWCADGHSLGWGTETSSGSYRDMYLCTPPTKFIAWFEEDLDYPKIPSFLYDIHIKDSHIKAAFMVDSQGTFYIPQ